MSVSVMVWKPPESGRSVFPFNYTWLLYTCLHLHVKPTVYTLHIHSTVSSVDTLANFYIHVHVHAHVNTQVYMYV